MPGMEEEEASECSSGCESGWTMYLDQSYESDVKPSKGGLEEEEEEDLSMVSDASSGPRHVQEHHDDGHQHHSCHCAENASFCSASYSPTSAAASVDTGGKRRRVVIGTDRQKHKQEAASSLDDTASSPLFGFSKASFNLSTNKKPSGEDVLEFSYGFSATHFQGKTTIQEQLPYFKPTPVLKPVGRE